MHTPKDWKRLGRCTRKALSHSNSQPVQEVGWMPCKLARKSSPDSLGEVPYRLRSVQGFWRSAAQVQSNCTDQGCIEAPGTALDFSCSLPELRCSSLLCILGLFLCILLAIIWASVQWGLMVQRLLQRKESSKVLCCI